MVTRKIIRSVVLAAGITSAVVMGTAFKAEAQSRELWLHNGETVTVEGFFLSGENIFGWCDDDCYDLDIALYDAEGNFIMQDVETDANPTVYAPYDGTFYVTLGMPNCSHPSGCAVWVDSDQGF